MNPPPASVPSEPSFTSTDDKTVAIVSYLTLVGFIIAIVLHSSKKTALGAYHLRQSLGLMLLSVALMFAGMILAYIPYVGGLMSMVLWFGLFVLWVLGLISAIKGEMKPVPVLGQQFQSWFAGAFN